MFYRIFAFITLTFSSIFSKEIIIPLHPAASNRLMKYAVVEIYLSPDSLPHFSPDGRLLSSGRILKFFRGYSPLLKKRQVIDAVLGRKVFSEAYYTLSSSGFIPQKNRLLISPFFQDDYVNNKKQKNMVFPLEILLAIIGTILVSFMTWLIKKRYIEIGGILSFFS